MTTTSVPAPSAVGSSTVTRTARPSLATTGRGALIGTALAVVAALVVLALFRVAAPVRVITGWAPDGTDLGVPDTVVTTVVSVLVAAAGLVVLDRVSRRSLRTWTIAVAAVTVLSFLPLWRLEIDTHSKVALTIMHLVVGAAVIAGQLLARTFDPLNQPAVLGDGPQRSPTASSTAAYVAAGSPGIEATTVA